MPPSLKARLGRDLASKHAVFVKTAKVLTMVERVQSPQQITGTSRKRHRFQMRAYVKRRDPSRLEFDAANTQKEKCAGAIAADSKARYRNDDVVGCMVALSSPGIFGDVE